MQMLHSTPHILVWLHIAQLSIGNSIYTYTIYQSRFFAERNDIKVFNNWTHLNLLACDDAIPDLLSRSQSRVLQVEYMCIPAYVNAIYTFTLWLFSPDVQRTDTGKTPNEHICGWISHKQICRSVCMSIRLFDWICFLKHTKYSFLAFITFYVRYADVW